MKKRLPTVYLLTAASFAGVGLSHAEIRPAEVAQLLDAGESIALIDVRGTGDFTRNHIPGAMNIPERIVDPLRLPSSRTVVIYDDGIGRANAGAVVERATEAGRDDVWELSGGLAAWESAGLPTTATKGFQRESIPGITYQNLTEAQGRGVVLLDVRQGAADTGDGDEPVAESRRDLTDLEAAFPEARVISRRGGDDTGAEPAAAATSASPASIDPEDELIVVIDDGDGSGEETVRNLRASGNRRVVLLAGGERILRREGRPGLERQSMGMRIIDGAEIDLDEGAEQ